MSAIEGAPLRVHRAGKGATRAASVSEKWSCNVEGICRRWWSPHAARVVAIYLARHASTRLPLSFDLHLCPLTLFLLLLAHLFPRSSPAVTHTAVCPHDAAADNYGSIAAGTQNSIRKRKLVTNGFSWNSYYFTVRKYLFYLQKSLHFKHPTRPLISRLAIQPGKSVN